MTRSVRLGVFISIALLIFSVAIFMVGSRQLLFTDTYRLYAGFDTVSGLAEGAEVRVGGVRVGTVASIQIPERPGGKVLVVMDLDDSTLKLVREDSVASIQTEGLLGSKFVSVSFGSPVSRQIRSGDTVRGVPATDISDVLRKTTDLLDTTNAAIKNVDSVTSNVKDITAKINSGQGTLGALVNNPKMYRELNQTAADIAETAEQAKAGAAGFNENMEALKHNFFLRGFFKRRGYENGSDVKKFEVAQLPDQPPSKEFLINADDLFHGSDTARLRKTQKLDIVGQYLQKNPFSMAVVGAYTDMKGDAQRDLNLSEARAYVVRDYLVQHFSFDDAALKTKGLGKQQPMRAKPAEGVEVFIYQNTPANSSHGSGNSSP